MESNNEEESPREIYFVDQRVQLLKDKNLKDDQILCGYKRFCFIFTNEYTYLPNTNPVIPMPLVVQANIKRPNM